MQVYVVENTRNRLFKIGLAGEPARRLRQIAREQRLALDDLRLAFGWACENTGVAYELERELHRILAESRVAGEWFACSLEAIRAAAEAVEPALWRLVHPVDNL